MWIGLARFLTAGIQGLRLVGKANPNRAVLEDIAATMLRCVDPRSPQFPPPTSNGADQRDYAIYRENPGDMCAGQLDVFSRFFRLTVL